MGRGALTRFITPLCYNIGSIKLKTETMRLYKTALLFISIFGASGCATSSSIDGMDKLSLRAGETTINYKAHTINFNGVSPGIVEQEYKSIVKISVRSQIRSYRFSNYLSGRKEPDVVVVLAISGRTAGLAIYDGAGAQLAEYSRGRVRNDSVIFEMATQNGVIRIKWFLGKRTIFSIFDSYDKKDRLATSEMTFYKTKLGGR